jgi:ribosomal protein S18 acetylase RimI-like enzyme
LIEKYLNLIDKNIIFERITPEYPRLSCVVSSSIGLPTPEKIAQVLESYQQPNQFLMGAFSTKNLIAVIGFQLKDTQATIKHISVLNEFKMQGVGKSLVHRLIRDYKPSTVSLETDGEAVEFYEKLGFICQIFNGEHGSRYRCYLNLLPS